MRYLTIRSIKPILENRNPCSDGIWPTLASKVHSVSSHLWEDQRVGGEGYPGNWTQVVTHLYLPWRVRQPACHGARKAPQFGKTNNPSEPLCCYRAWKAPPAICWYRRVLLSLWFALSLKFWSVKWWQRQVLKCMYAFLCLEVYKILAI